MNSMDYGGAKSETGGSFGVYALNQNLDFCGIRDMGANNNHQVNNEGEANDGE